MSLKKEKLNKLRSTVRKHLNWIVREIAGEDALTEEEKKDLKDFKSLPKQASDFIHQSFVLGRLKSILKKKEYEAITPSRLDKAIKEANLTPLEMMALDEARRGAGNYIKNLTADIEAGVFQRISEAEGKLVSEATIRNIVREEVAFAVLEEKTWKELAASLSDSLKVDYSDRIEMIARTELHSAKQKGIAQAIATKVDIYGSSSGPDSNVSVVTQTGRCEDCARLYEEKDGNPKIFKLAYLLANGSNATRNHKKVNKQHIHWVAVVPPGHPRCFCELVYVPPGYMWKDRRLVLESKENLIKAIGDSTFSPVKKPQGPPQKGPTPPPQPGNVAGSPAISSQAGTSGGPATPASGGATPPPGGISTNGGVGAKIKYEYWSGDGAPSSDGGWESYEKRSGGVGYRRPLGSGGKKGAAQEDAPVNKVKEAEEWYKQGHPDAVKLDHLANGTFVDLKMLGEDEDDNRGVTESYKALIGGNGSALVKPIAFSGNHPNAEKYATGELITEGAQSVPMGTFHKREKAAYNAHIMLGLTDFVPPTTTRSFQGSDASIQSWEDAFQPIDHSFLSEKGMLNKKHEQHKNSPEGAGKKYKSNMDKLLDICPADKREKLIQKLSDGAVMALALNHNDQHLDNVMVNDDFDVRFIDNSVTAANGMEGAKVAIMRSFHSLNRKLQVSDTMMTRFENTSLGDMKRALGDDLEDWAIGQTYLRMKYLTHLQKTEGHLDYEKFRTTIGSANGKLLGETQPRLGFWDDYVSHAGGLFGTSEEFNRRRNAGTLQNQLFESFSKQWIQDSLAKPEDHPEYIAAKELDELGVFMGPGFAMDAKKYRDEGRHKAYEKTIKAGYPPKDVKTANGIVTKPKEAVSGTAKTDVHDIGDISTLAMISNKNATPVKRESPVKDLPKEKTIGTVAAKPAKKPESNPDEIKTNAAKAAKKPESNPDEIKTNAAKAQKVESNPDEIKTNAPKAKKVKPNPDLEKTKKSLTLYVRLDR